MAGSQQTGENGSFGSKLVYHANLAISQLLGARQAASDVERGTAGGSVEEDLLATTVSHGIPLRATLVGLMMGSANATITIAATLIERGTLGALPLPLFAQAGSKGFRGPA